MHRIPLIQGADLAAILSGPGYFTCERLQPARISFRQCLINYQEARNRLGLSTWLIGPLAPCLDCPEGAARNEGAAEVPLPTPVRTAWRVQEGSPRGLVFAARAAATKIGRGEATGTTARKEATMIQESQVPPDSPLSKGGKKKPPPPPGMTAAVARALGLI